MLHPFPPLAPRAGQAAAAAAASAGVRVVLDCGGVDAPLSAALLASVHTISPNETELQRLTGLPTGSDAQVIASLALLALLAPRVLARSFAPTGESRAHWIRLITTQPFNACAWPDRGCCARPTAERRGIWRPGGGPG